MRYALALLLLCAPLHATTYYVSKAGSDSAAGGISTPWLTLGKAASTIATGDTVFVGDGDYDEHVQETTAGTTYVSTNQFGASFRAFRCSAGTITIDGFKIDKYSGVGNTWGAAVRIEASSDGCKVRNCRFTDLPHIIAHDLSFGSQTITSASSDFIAAGFKVGSKVYLGASGLLHPTHGRLYYNDHDTTWTITAITQHTITLGSGSAAWIGDTGSNWWGFIRAGTGNSGFPAVLAVEAAGAGPDDIEITDNTIDNWPSHAINITGNGHLIEGNHLTNLKSFRFLQFSGSDHIIRRNVVRNNPNVLHYSPAELLLLDHPEGTGWYDYAVGMLSGFIGDGNDSNVLIEENWFENNENQIGLLDDSSPGAAGVHYNRNVFIGLTQHFSGGRDGMKWTDNTFFRCAWFEAPHPLSTGGEQSDANTGYEFTGNLFVACGPHGATETRTRGFYSISNWVVSPVKDENFVTSEEVTGYLSKTNFTETNGVNGGDPVFYNALDPIGPDGAAFTADDGLKVLANSPAAAIGGGALGVRPVTTGQPVAHFRLTTPTGWFEGTGASYSPVWQAQLPTTRTGPQRPYTTPVKIGEAPVAATFSADKSVSGVAGASTNTAITTYLWNFGDGSAVQSTSSATISHTFTTFGDFSVVLTVTNSAGNSHTTSQIYRVTGVTATPGDVIEVPTDYLTIGQAIQAADAGDTILVSAGVYPEIVSTVRSGTAAQRITIDGQGVASVREINFRHDYITIQGFNVNGTKSSWQKVLFATDADFNILRSCNLDSEHIAGYHGIGWSVSSSAPEGSDNLIEMCTIRRVFGACAVTFNGARNVIRNCLVDDGLKMDFVRLTGSYHKVQNNIFQNNLNTPIATGWHPDFIQTFANNGEISHDHIIEGNIVHNAPVAQLTQLSGGGQPEVRDWTFRNNLFSYVGLQASCTIPGVKYYNNVFYRCYTENTDPLKAEITSGGSVLHFGSRKHDRHDIPSDHPDYPTLINPVASGSLVNGYWYNVELDEVPIAANGIQAGVSYKAYTRSTTKVVYNGVQYVNHEVFTGVGGVPGYTLTGGTNGTVYLNGSVTYNGTEYTRDQHFQANATTTFTTSTAATKLYRNLLNFAHNVKLKNNAFIECGTSTNNENGWYSVDIALTGAEADYNYVSKPGFAPVRLMSPGVPVGGPGLWNKKGWYEPHGVNGGNPSFTDPTNFDFRPQTGSILIDEGVDLGTAVPNDFAGAIRPLGTSTDIGAFEYDDGSPPPDPPDPPAPQAPAAPDTVTQAGATTSSITLQWADRSDNETAFEVYWSREGLSYSLLTTTAANVTTATHSGLSASISRYYQIRAINTVGNSAFVNAGPFATLATTNPPAAATSFTATALGGTSIRLNWTNPATDETHMEIERSTDQTAWVALPNLPANATAFTANGLAPTTTYYFRVRNVGSGGSSAWANSTATTTDGLPPPIGGRYPRRNATSIVPQ